jgi:hypothetical protein
MKSRGPGFAPHPGQPLFNFFFLPKNISYFNSKYSYCIYAQKIIATLVYNKIASAEKIIITNSCIVSILAHIGLI